MTPIDGPNPPEPVRDEEYFEQGHSSPHNPPAEPERKEYVARTMKDDLNDLAFGKPSQGKPATPTAEDALADLDKILRGSESDERELSDMAERIWGLLFPYIASEDGPDYSEANMEVLCADVLPKVWDLILESE